MTDTQPKLESHLPVRGFLVILVLLIMIVAFTASIFGENQKINITARRLMNYVAARDYEEAYELLTASAQEKMNVRQFKATMTQLRMYLRAVYGTNFSDEFKFTSRKKFWLPWIDESRRAVTVGLYRKKSGIANEVREMLTTPDFAGPAITDLLIIVREGNRWLVDDINFNPEDHADVIQKLVGRERDIYTPTENGFTVEGFVYDRRTATPEDRALLIDALSQALEELQKDTGAKTPESGGILDIIP